MFNSAHNESCNLCNYRLFQGSHFEFLKISGQCSGHRSYCFPTPLWLGNPESCFFFLFRRGGLTVGAKCAKNFWFWLSNVKMPQMGKKLHYLVKKKEKWGNYDNFGYFPQILTSGKSGNRTNNISHHSNSHKVVFRWRIYFYFFIKNDLWGRMKDKELPYRRNKIVVI